MRSRLAAPFVAVIAVFAVFAVGACGGSSNKAAGGAGAVGTAITIKNFAFSPTPLHVSPGATVTVTDKDSSEHTVTSSDKTSFDTGHVPAGGGTKTFTAPTRAGTYAFHCNIHQYMTGTLVVG